MITILTRTRLKLEDYAAVGDFMLQSFERDKAEFVKHYKTMDENLLKAFKKANEEVKKLTSGMAQTKEQQKITTQLYTLLDEVKGKIVFLSDYAKRAKLDTAQLTKTAKQLASRNAEGAVKMLRDALPYYQTQAAAIADMPEGFLEDIQAKIIRIEKLNADQNASINLKKGITGANREQYENLYAYLAEVARAGKLIYKGTPKADEYTLKAIHSRVQAAVKANAPKETPKG